MDTQQGCRWAVAVMSGVIAGAMLLGCAATPAQWPARTVDVAQLRPISPIRLQMNWMSGDGRPTGSVHLRGHLLTDGSVGVVEIVETSGRRELDQAAVQALKLARFSPYEVGGQAVEATLLAKFDMPERIKPAAFPR